MNQAKMHLIKKVFNNDSIRTVWDKESEKYYISIIDVVGVLTGSDAPRKYWNWLKNKLQKEEGLEVSSITRQLKLKAEDGKYRLTDVCDIEGMFRIIQSIPSKKVEPLKQWLAKLGRERIDETFDPSIALQRAMDLYRAKGYDEAWIAKRIKALQERKQLTDVWKESGISAGLEYAILTNEIYKTWPGMIAKEYKQFKGLRKENLRDNMDSIELILTDLSEESTKRIAQEKKPQGLKENINVAKKGGNISKVARESLEKEIGKSIITKDNNLNYQYIKTEEELIGTK